MVPSYVEEFMISHKLNGEFDSGNALPYPFNMNNNEGALFLLIIKYYILQVVVGILMVIIIVIFFMFIEIKLMVKYF